MAALRADQPARRVGGDPAVALAPVPAAVFRAQYPLPAFSVDDSQLADGGPEAARVEVPAAALFDQVPVPGLGNLKGIDRHLRPHHIIQSDPAVPFQHAFQHRKKHT